jgi:drug/metabolite transporter (DMT)-like permease
VNTTPVHVGLFSLLVLRERLDRRFVWGALLAVAGAALLLGISRDDVLHWRGGLFALGAGVFYAGYLLLMTAARRRGSAAPALFLASASAAGVLGLYALALGDPFAGFPAHAWAAMAGAACVSQIGGVLAIVWSLRHLPPTVTSVALLVQPLGTALLGWWLLAEPLAPLQALGGAAVLAGVALAARAKQG